MDHGDNRTPCRRLGLSRSASKSRHTPYAKRDASSKSTPKNSRSSPTDITTPKSSAFEANDGLQLKSLDNEVARADEKLKVNHPIPKQLFELQTEQTQEECKIRSNAPPPTAEELNDLRKRIAFKENRLKELQNATVYHKKHDPDKLNELIKTWLNGCQEALQILLINLRNRGQPTEMAQLLSQLGIPAELVNYDEKTQEFVQDV